MGEIQLTYETGLKKGYAGQPADMIEKEIVTRAAEGASVIPFGYCVERGTSERQAKLAAGGAFLGLAVRVHKAGLPQYVEKEAMSVAQQGNFYAPVTGIGGAGAQLCYVAASGLLTTAAAGVGIIATRVELLETKLGAGTEIVKVKVLGKGISELTTP